METALLFAKFNYVIATTSQCVWTKPQEISVYQSELFGILKSKQGIEIDKARGVLTVNFDSNPLTRIAFGETRGAGSKVLNFQSGVVSISDHRHASREDKECLDTREKAEKCGRIAEDIATNLADWLDSYTSDSEDSNRLQWNAIVCGHSLAVAFSDFMHDLASKRQPR
jgi:hypothetical protein